MNTSATGIRVMHGATSNIHGMVVTYLTDCIADACSTWFYKIPIGVASNTSIGSALILRHLISCAIRSVVRRCSHPWLLRIALTLTSLSTNSNPRIHQSMPRIKSNWSVVATVLCERYGNVCC